MIDLHTHLLPDWDDGAKDWAETQKMSEIAHTDGIQKIVITPHIFRMSKHNDNLDILQERKAELHKKKAELPVEFYEGAEVFLHHDILSNLRKHHLTINHSNYFFIEFPSDYVLPGVKDLFFNIMLEGYIPIISHPERNAVFQERPDLIYELIKMDCLAQVTAKSIIGEFGTEVRKTAHYFLTHNFVHLIASDAHDARNRPPLLSQAVEEAGKIVGNEKAMAMVTSIPQAILDNRDISDWDEPISPHPKRKWSIKLPRF
ncbi:MAG: CpsB/CapC family capsule biosynthesis tyrosine phosphatase [Candidatus Aminicenantales bacterium]